MQELERKQRESDPQPPTNTDKAEENEEKEPSTTVAPPWLGLLKCKRPQTTGFRGGTATVIAPTIVCTAAHVVYDSDAKEAISQGWFLRGFTGQTEIQRLDILKVYVPAEYVDAVDNGRSAADHHDIAFVQLAAPVPNSVVARTPRFTAVNGSLANQNLTLYGYPGANTLRRETAPVVPTVLSIALDEVNGPGDPLLLTKTRFASGGSGGPVLLGPDEDILIGVVTDLVGGAFNQLLLFTDHARQQYAKALSTFQ